MAFDPDKYLASKGFDPDAYLRGNAPAEPMSREAFNAVKAEGNVVPPPTPKFTPSGEKPQPSFTDLNMLRGHPLIRFAEGAASPVIGAGQLAANVAGFGAPVNEFISESERRAQEARGALGSEGVDFWKLGGTVASPAVLGALKIPAAATVLGRSGQGAAIGAAFGAATPVTDADNFWKRKSAQVTTSALLGGAIPPAIDLTRKVYSIGRNMLDPLLPGGAERGASRIISEAAGPKRAAIEAELEKQLNNAVPPRLHSQLVSGSQPTAPEAAVRAGSPEFSALQKIAADIRPSAYSDIARSQEAARLAAVRSVGKTPADLKAAEALRSATGQQNYGSVVDDMIATTDGRIKQILERPSMREALKKAKALAEEQGKSFGSVEDGFTVGNMQSVKMALDDLVKNPERFGIGASEVNAIQNTRGEFVNWLSKQSPKWELARKVYAQQSRPINEMQVGQELERALAKPIGAGERPGVFAGAMRDAPRTMKRATGQARFDDLGEVLKPENLSKVKGVLEDLSRKAEFERLAPLGRGKASEAAQHFSLPATGPLNQQYMIFKTVLGRVSKGVNEKTLETMADALQVPSETLRLLRMAPTQQREELINQIISAKFGRGAIAVSSELSSEGIDKVR